MIRISNRISGCLAILLTMLLFTGWIIPSTAAEKSTSIIEARLLSHLKYLASDKCEGRGITTKGIHLAADYIADEMKKVGLKPAGPNNSFFQPFEVTRGAKLGQDKSLVLKNPQGDKIELTFNKEYTVFGFGSSGKVKAPLVFVGHGITSADDKYDDYKGIDVKGKIVVVLRQVPGRNNKENKKFPAAEGGINPHAALTRKAANAEAHQAAGVIFVSDNQTAAEANDRLRNFNSTSRGFDPVSIPLVHMKRIHLDKMLKATHGKSLLDIEKEINQTVKPNSLPLKGWSCEMEIDITRQKVACKNVIGVLEGKGPLADETVVIGAHYDHLGYGGRGSLARGSKKIHYGADDNASGTTALIELANRFGQLNNRQGRRLVFMAFSAEESGLLGSAHYCKNPLIPLEKTVAMINLDMVGRLRDNKITIGGLGTGEGYMELIDKLNKSYKFEIAKSKAGFGPSDHASFYAKKIPVFFFFTNTHPQYHRPTDTVDTINVAGMIRIIDMVEELAIYLTYVKEAPKYVKTNARFRPGRVRRGPTLGIMPNYADDKAGLLLTDVRSGGPAAKAGMKGGDRIVEIEGKPIKNIQTYMAVMAGQKKGETIKVKILRKDKPMMLKVKLD